MIRSPNQEDLAATKIMNQPTERILFAHVALLKNQVIPRVINHRTHAWIHCISWHISGFSETWGPFLV